MDSRDLIRGGNDLHVLIDTESFNNEITESNDTAKKLLQYQYHGLFTFLRTTGSATDELLSNIEQYRIEKNEDQHSDSLYYPNSWASFRYTDEKLESIQDRLSNLGIDIMKKRLRPIAVRSRLDPDSSEENGGIFITENKDILRSRRALESEFTISNENNLNIMSIEEASEFIGLYMRFRREYVMYPQFNPKFSVNLDVSYWNWSLADLAVPHLGKVDGLGTRLENLITGLDELGYQYYMGTGNHTNNYTTYHFNYCISLITGMFDALALFTRDMYSVNLDDRRTTIRTGEPLFKKLRSHNENLWHYIHSNHPFVELIYTIRPQVVHKDGVLMRGPGYSYRKGDDYSYWNSHIIKLDDMAEKYQTRFRKYYKQMDDELLKYDPLTKWGLICTSDETLEMIPTYDQFIEPYQFIKSAIEELMEYVDGFLKLVGNENRLQMLSEEQPDRYDELMEFKQHMMAPLI